MNHSDARGARRILLGAGSPMPAMLLGSLLGGRLSDHATSVARTILVERFNEGYAMIDSAMMGAIALGLKPEDLFADVHKLSSDECDEPAAAPEPTHSYPGRDARIKARVEAWSEQRDQAGVDELKQMAKQASEAHAPCPRTETLGDIFDGIGIGAGGFTPLGVFKLDANDPDAAEKLTQSILAAIARR